MNTVSILKQFGFKFLKLFMGGIEKKNKDQSDAIFYTDSRIRNSSALKVEFAYVVRSTFGTA